MEQPSTRDSGPAPKTTTPAPNREPEAATTTPQPKAADRGTEPVTVMITRFFFHPARGSPSNADEARITASKLTAQEDLDDAAHQVLAHEIVRQAVLVAAREQLGLVTRDETLGESASSDPAEATIELVLKTSVSQDQVLTATLSRLSEQGARSLWQEAASPGESSEQGYVSLVEAAEKWSREAMPGALVMAGLPQGAVPSGSAAVPEQTESRLWSMSFIEQFAAVRELHRTADESGRSPALYGALARGYANLGMLTEFHWNQAHKALKARGLIYAQRTIATTPGPPAGPWQRAYVLALTGRHQQALDDLEEARQTDASSEPAWAGLIEAYCRFDAERIATAAEERRHEPLAAVLRFLVYEHPPATNLTLSHGVETLKISPFCFRVLDGMYDVQTLGNLHRVTELAPGLFTAALRKQLPGIADLPSGASRLLKIPDSESLDEVELVRQLNGADRMGGGGELSWSCLAQMIAETHFVHAWSRAAFMRFYWSVPTADYLEAIRPLIKDHRYRSYVEATAYSDSQATEVLSQQLGDLRSSSLPVRAQAKLLRIQLCRNPQDYWRHTAGPKPPVDATYADLVALLDLSSERQKADVGRRLARISPHSPAGHAAVIQYGPPSTPTDIADYEEQHGWHPAVLEALVHSPGTSDDDVKRLLKKWIQQSPDYRAFAALAGIHMAEGDLDRWKKTLDGFLEQPSTGLEHARVRVEIAEQLMGRGQWSEAQPYAEEAAESYAAWAMLCAVRCYEGLEQWDKAEDWVRRTAQRYPEHAMDWYYWCHRTGEGDLEAAGQWTRRYLAPHQGSDHLPLVYAQAMFHLLEGDAAEAQQLFERLYRLHGSSVHAMFAAMAADMAGDRQACSRILQSIAGRRTRTHHLAELLLPDVDDEDSTSLDLQRIDQLLSDFEGDTQHQFYLLVGLYFLRHQHEETGRKFLRLARDTDEPRSHVRALVEGMIRQHGPSGDRQ